ncbi:MAG: GrpB family protein [Pleurocapsa sp.]
MDEIIIVEHNPVWQLLFQEEVTRIRKVLDTTFITRIEHFGSTAVPGLAAKPIIDLLSL